MFRFLKKPRATEPRSSSELTRGLQQRLAVARQDGFTEGFDTGMSERDNHWLIELNALIESHGEQIPTEELLQVMTSIAGDLQVEPTTSKPAAPTDRQIYHAALIRRRVAKRLGEKTPAAVERIISEGNERFGRKG